MATGGSYVTCSKVAGPLHAKRSDATCALRLERRTVRFPAQLRCEKVAVDRFQVDDSGVTPKVEEILPDAEIARAASLLAGEMSERVIDLHALA